MNFIYKNFDNSIVPELGLWTGTYAIDGRFIIKKNGKVSNIKVKSETLELKNEMERVLNLMPDFIRPGQVDGNNVEIEYDLPFKIFVQ